MPITVEEAERQMAALAKQIAKLQPMQEKYNELESFVKLGRKLSPSDAQGHSEQITTMPNPAKRLRSKNATAEIADTVLRNYGPLQLDQLLDEMLKAGWTASGDRIKDRKSAYAAVHRDTVRFEQGPDARWRLKEKVA